MVCRNGRRRNQSTIFQFSSLISLSIVLSLVTQGTYLNLIIGIFSYLELERGTVNGIISHLYRIVWIIHIISLTLITTSAIDYLP